MYAERLVDQPIISSSLDASIGHNINGPSLIRVPDWVANRLGRYYLYFAHHQGRYIRMAYADDLVGPWRIYTPGVLSLESSLMNTHVASPDVIVDERSPQIRLYFHGDLKPADQPVEGEMRDRFFTHQRTRVALSANGLDFQVRSEVIGSGYLRVFEHGGGWYGLSMPGLLGRSVDGLGRFEPGPQVIESPADRSALRFDEAGPVPRHMALKYAGDRVEVFYTRMGDCPEQIVAGTMQLTGDWRSWRVGSAVPIMRPERSWEGANEPLVASSRGAAHKPVHQLRDPAYYEEEGQGYLVYSVAGEMGLGIARIVED